MEAQKTSQQNGPGAIALIGHISTEGYSLIRQLDLSAFSGYNLITLEDQEQYQSYFFAGTGHERLHAVVLLPNLGALERRQAYHFTRSQYPNVYIVESLRNWAFAEPSTNGKYTLEKDGIPFYISQVDASGRLVFQSVAETIFDVQNILLGLRSVA